MLVYETWFFGAAFISYLLATAAYFVYLAMKNETAGKIGTITAALGLVAQTVALVTRSIAAGHVPFTNMYEFTSSFVWGIVLVYLGVERVYKVKTLGAFVLPVAVILIGIASVLPKDVEPLVPALQSYWLQLHVSTAIIAYGAFAVAFGLSVMYLLVVRGREKNPTGFLATRLPEPNKLDLWSYRTISLGFPFMTLVIITGAIWAEKAWGRYWSWDPKETWSLITWFIYAVYLHARITYGWQGKRSAWMSVLGFAAVLFTYFGVNLLLSGLHSYAGL